MKSIQRFAVASQPDKGKNDIHVSSNPRKHNIRSAISVMIRLLRRRITMFLLLRGFNSQSSTRRTPESIDIFTRGRNFDFHNIFPTRILDFFGTSQVLCGTIVTLRTPTDLSVSDSGYSSGRKGAYQVTSCRLHMAYITAKGKSKPNYTQKRMLSLLRMLTSA